ncbi:XRE family transcriptional regulator [Coriobacteriales bacterium OH1046]|nr:XRE family transcriptional regulator [Coriobacteriales bacterium OH1046]
MDEVFQQALGKRIKSLRLERTSLSQEKFAYQAGIDRTYYASIEQGKHAPTINLLRKIASSLGLTLSELLEGL